jgi:hypothetical protein
MILLRLIKISVHVDQHYPIWLNDNSYYDINNKRIIQLFVKNSQTFRTRK